MAFERMDSHESSVAVGGRKFKEAFHVVANVINGVKVESAVRSEDRRVEVAGVEVWKSFCHAWSCPRPLCIFGKVLPTIKSLFEPKSEFVPSTCGNVGNLTSLICEEHYVIKDCLFNSGHDYIFKFFNAVMDIGALAGLSRKGQKKYEK